MERFDSGRTDWLNRPEYPKPFKSAIVPEQQKYIYNKHRIVINSWDRDRFVYLNPNEYKIRLPCRYRNVAVFEIDYLTMPNFSTSDYYFLVQIKEINQGPYESLDNEISKSMALIPNKTGLSNFNYIYEAPGDTSYVKNFIKRFVDTPIASLETITLKISKKDGKAVNFGQDMLPYNHEFDFNSTQIDYDNVNNTLVLNTPNHGLGIYDTITDIITNNSIITNDSINIFNVTITNNVTRQTTDLTTLHNSFVISSHMVDPNIFTINAPITVPINLIPIGFTNYTINGKWKRNQNAEGWYSRNEITNTIFDNDDIKITTDKNHNLKQYDRIYISNNTSTINTVYNNNHHIVIKTKKEEPTLTDTEFKISKGNIGLDDITSNVQSQLDADNDNEIDNPIANSATFGYIQRYGEYDPTIQNQMIISITCRDEDDSNVRSENIKYGTSF